MKKILSSFLVLLLAACGSPSGKTGVTDGLNADSLVALSQPRYAKGFQVRSFGENVRLVDISDPQGGEHIRDYHFALVSRGTKAEGLPDGYEVIEVPIRHCITMTTLQLAGFIALEALDRVSGITSTRSLKNADVKARIKDGRMVKIGIEGDFDPELILAAQPDIIFISPFKRGGYEALTESGITLVPHLGYKETTALGQAEWVRFLGMFLGMEREADAYFSHVARRYEEVRAMTDTIAVRPTVMSGEMHGGQWYAVGGRNSLAQLFRDAGADYVLGDNTETGGVYLDYEEHYAKAAHADYWRILNAYDGDFDYEVLRQSDSRYADFRAFRQRQVLYCNMRRTAYYEQAPMHPDQLLEDFVFAFHPNLMPKDYQPVFYHLLK